MRLGRYGYWFVALNMLYYATSAIAVPSGSLAASKPELAPSWLVCANGKEAAELTVPHIPLMGPPDNATVQVGAPVTFSGEANHPLTFNMASSAALLSNPDIDSGPGSLQPGTSLYMFTSTKATATPETIYWDASYAFTPEDCEEPSTFTTPMRTFTVVSPPAIETGATAESQPEDGAPAAGGVSLDGNTIDVQGAHDAVVKLTCSGTCSGKLVLTAKVHSKRKRVKTNTIGTTFFSIRLGRTAAVKLVLNTTGRELLRMAHGRLSAGLTILGSSAVSPQGRTEIVHLVRLES